MTGCRSELRLDDVLPYLQGVKKQANGNYSATCPLCGKAGHLYLAQKDKLLVYCQKCNAPGGDILKELHRLGAKPAEVEQMDYKKTKPIEDYYHKYMNPDGTEAYYKRRRKWTDGHKVFNFVYQGADGKAVYSKPEGCNNLYNLDLLAKHEQDVLYIVEGEKCADAMVKAGLLATTSNTGAQKQIKLSATDKELLESYAERVVIPDNDEKGGDYAAAWNGAKILNLKDIWADCPPKGDVADYLAQGGNVDAIKNYKFTARVELSKDYLTTCSRYDLVAPELMQELYKVKEPSQRQQLLAMARLRAGELTCKREFESCWKAYLQSEAAKGIRSDNMTKFPQQLFSLRCGEWQTGAAGVYRSVQVGTDLKNEYASPIPIMPAEILVNTEDETEKVRLTYFKSGRWQTVVAPRSILANKSKIVNLADNGVEVNSENAGLLVKYLAEVIALNPDILPRVKSIDHMGWSDAGFIPYTEDVKLDCEEQYKSLVAAISSKGTLQEWAEYVKPLRQNLYMRLILAASFASVLVEKVNALPFILHLWGGTGSGKTVAMMVAASVWGNPAMGRMVRTMNMTVNSMMSTAATLKSLPFFGDELQTIKSRFENYDTLIMRVTEGVDRGRMTNAVYQKQRTWLNSFIFTGEEPCTESQSGGGVKNRVIELECDHKIVENGNAVVNYLNEHYGCAGRVFVEALKGRQLSKDHNDIMRVLLEAAGTTEKQAMAMALMLQADYIASEAIWGDKSDVLDPKLVLDILKSKTEVSASERAWAYTLDLISQNADKFDTDMSDHSGSAYWGRIKPASGLVYINKSVLERELQQAGFSYAAIKKDWADAGYLVKTPQGKFFGVYSFASVRSNYVMLAASKKG